MNPITLSWFDDIDDPDVRLISLSPKNAELWCTLGNIGFMIEITNSKVTGDDPDLGKHFTITF